MTRTFPARLLQHYRDHPDRASIVFLKSGQEDRTLTYHDLYTHAAGFCCQLQKAAIAPGEVVILLIDHREALLYAFWGAVLQGAIPSILPFLTEKLNPERYLADLNSLIAVTQPAAIITYREFTEIVETAAHPGTSVRKILYLEDVKPVKKDLNLELEGSKVKPEDIVLLQHSSGTTGLQKGVALSHQAVFNQLDALQESISLNSDEDVIVSWLPLYHDMGLIAGFILPILSGTKLILMSPFDWVRAPYRLLQAVSEYRGTLSWLPNFAYNFCAKKIRDRHLEEIDLSSWRAVINCSEPVRWESHQTFFQQFKDYGLSRLALQTSYAMAENTFGVTQSDLESEPTVQRIDQDRFLIDDQIIPAADNKPSLIMMSSGRPIPNTRIRVQDQKGHILADNHVGEIAIKSNSMLQEYYRRPDVTAQAFQDGWFLTGDYGYLSNQEIFVTGRKKDLIIVGGKNIYPGDLEELIYEIPGIHPGRAVVFGIFNDQLGTEEVIAIAEADDPDPLVRQKLADQIRTHITQNSPVSLRMVKITDPMWIIKTSSGKVSRSGNKKKYLAEKSSHEKA